MKRARRRRRAARRLPVILAFLLCGGLLRAADEGPAGDETDPPRFEQMELRLARDSLLASALGGPGERAHVYAGQFLTWDDNVYLRDEDEAGDTLRTTLAGADLRAEEEGIYSFRLWSEVRKNKYDDLPDEDSVEYEIEPEAVYILDDGLVLEARGRFSNVVSPLDAVTVDRVDQYTHRGNFTVRLMPDERWGVDVGTMLKSRAYGGEGLEDLDYGEWRLYAAPYYVAGDRLKVGGELLYGAADYEKDFHNEPEYAQLSATVTYLPGERSSLVLRLGYQGREYDGGRDDDDDDFGGLVGSAVAAYEHSAELCFDASVWRAPQDSSEGNFYALTRYGVGVTASPAEKLRLRGELFYEDIDTSRGADASRWGSNLSATYSLTEWASAGGSYQYRSKDEEGGDEGYAQNKGTLGLWLTF